MFQPERSRKSFGRVIVQRREVSCTGSGAVGSRLGGWQGRDWMRLASPTKGTAHVGAWVQWASEELEDWRVFTAPALNSFLSVMLFKLGNDMTKFLFSNLPVLQLVECGLWTTAREDIRGPVWVGLGKEDCIHICGSWWGCTSMLAWVSSYFWNLTFAAEGWCLARSEATVRNYLRVQRRSDKSPDWRKEWIGMMFEAWKTQFTSCSSGFLYC